VEERDQRRPLLRIARHQFVELLPFCLGDHPMPGLLSPDYSRRIRE
jgi:hypothetical protein